MSREDLERLAEAMNGLAILGCLPGSPADLAGLRYGDVVLEVNGVTTSSWSAYAHAVSERPRVMRVRYFRGGAEHLVELTMPERGETPNPAVLLSAVAEHVLSRVEQAALVVDADEPLPN